MTELTTPQPSPREPYEIDDRQALFNAATAISRVAMKANRHPKTRAVLLSHAESIRAEATALLSPSAPEPTGEREGLR